MDKVILVAALGAGVWAVNKYMKSYENRQKLFGKLEYGLEYAKQMTEEYFREDDFDNPFVYQANKFNSRQNT